MAVLFFAQIAILLFFAVSAIVWSVKGGTFAGMAAVSLKPSGSLMGITGILVGAAAAVFSYLGFEAPASMAGELEDPQRSVPRAIMISAILGTLINVFMAWAFVLAIPTKGLFSLLYFVNPVPAMAGVIWQNLPPFCGGWQHLINLAGIVSGLVGALVVAAVLFVVSIAGVVIWHLYKAGGMKWWHIKAPYAVASPVGGIAAVVLAVMVLAVSAMALKAKKGGDPE